MLARSKQISTLPCRDLPDLPSAPRAPGRNSTCSTEATVARHDAEEPAAELSSSRVEDQGALPIRVHLADPAFAADAASAKVPEKEAVGAGQGMWAAGGSDVGAAPQGAAPDDAAPESGDSSAAANEGHHGAATSNDVDPFAETDAALHSNAESEVPAPLPCSMHLLDIRRKSFAELILALSCILSRPAGAIRL